MVLIAAAVLTRSKVLLSRQFVEMSKSRIEGLLAAFSKLIQAGKQHTFLETDSVRYVYQPMEKLYMVLITTKASNILEDLETLRLFAKVVPEYCKSLEESDVFDNAFNLIFAFDEIVALGYRESVNLAQVRTFVEMDSHEEKVYQAVRQSQERDAKQKMQEKAKELQRQRIEANKSGKAGRSTYSASSNNFSNTSAAPSIIHDNNLPPSEPVRPTFNKPSGPSKALKLGSKSHDIDSFVDQLKSEGERVSATTQSSSSQSSKDSQITAPLPNTENIHLIFSEKITLVAGRDGGLQNMEVNGMTTLKVQDESCGMVRIKFKNDDNRGILLQTHPLIDKELFKNEGLIALKNLQKPFPINTDVGIIKWRYQTTDEAQIPLTINCWPSENGSGGCDVNIEYELQNEDLELLDVIISIRIPPGSGVPVVGECEGEYLYEPRRNVLLWQLTVVDSSNKTGSMEFSVQGAHVSDFFPVQVSFQSTQSFVRLHAIEARLVGSETPVPHSIETSLATEKYEIV